MKNQKLRVCARCLMGIESHEGKQLYLTLYIDGAEWFDNSEDYEKESRCNWCEESGFSELYEI